MSRQSAGLLRRIPMMGLRFGRLLVIKRAKSVRGKFRWICRCDCGATATRDGSALRYGHVKSCGCLSRETAAARMTTHGHTINKKGYTSEYARWCSMKERCGNPKTKSYHRYGGRGIKVCKRWAASFEAFYADMGQVPPGKSLDRIDNNGNYEPGNCRWATKHQQAANARNAKIVQHDGRALCVSEWARILGIKTSTISQRLRLGWPVKMALTPGNLRWTYRLTLPPGKG
jgi:hypothetical protein